MWRDKRRNGKHKKRDLRTINQYYHVLTTRNRTIWCHLNCSGMIIYLTTCFRSSMACHLSPSISWDFGLWSSAQNQEAHSLDHWPRIEEQFGNSLFRWLAAASMRFTTWRPVPFAATVPPRNKVRNLQRLPTVDIIKFEHTHPKTHQPKSTRVHRANKLP
jgi:hypothetical protein